MKHLRTVEAIVRELGGNSAVATMIQRTSPNITHWINTGKIPAKYYFAMIAALEQEGCEAPRSLWNFFVMARNNADAA